LLDVTGYEGYLNNSYGPPTYMFSSQTLAEGGGGSFLWGVVQELLKPFANMASLTDSQSTRKRFLQSFEPRNLSGALGHEAGPLFGLLIPGVGEESGGLRALEVAESGLIDRASVRFTQGSIRTRFGMGYDK